MVFYVSFSSRGSEIGKHYTSAAWKCNTRTMYQTDLKCYFSMPILKLALVFSFPEK